MYKKSRIYYICKIKFIKKYTKDHKVRDYTDKYNPPAYNIYNLKYNVSNKVSVVSYNGSNYDFHFILKGMAKESEG